MILSGSKLRVISNKTFETLQEEDVNPKMMVDGLLTLSAHLMAVKGFMGCDRVVELWKFDNITNRIAYLRTESIDTIGVIYELNGHLLFTNTWNRGQTILKLDEKETRVTCRIEPGKFATSRYVDVSMTIGKSNVFSRSTDNYSEIYAVDSFGVAKLILNGGCLHSIRSIDDTVECSYVDDNDDDQSSIITLTLPHESSTVSDTSVANVEVITSAIKDDGNDDSHVIGYCDKEIIESKFTPPYNPHCNTSMSYLTLDKNRIATIVETYTQVDGGQESEIHLSLYSIVRKLSKHGVKVISEASLLYDKLVQLEPLDSTTSICKVSDEHLLIQSTRTNYSRWTIVDLKRRCNQYCSTSCASVFVPKFTLEDTIRIYKPFLLDVGMYSDLANLICSYLEGG